MPELPWDKIARSQRAAAGLLADTVASLVDMGKAGVTRPEEVLEQVSALAAAMPPASDAGGLAAPDLPAEAAGRAAPFLLATPSWSTGP